MTGKPIRRVRRFLKKSYGNCITPTNTRGHGRYTFLAEASDERLEAIFKGKGKGKGAKGRRTTGKGFGRKTNPKDKQGNIMKCHRCGSTEHLLRQCPHPKGDGKGYSQHLSTPLYPSAHEQQRQQQQPHSAIYPLPEERIPGPLH